MLLRQTLVLVDRKGRVVAVCAGRPRGDETWEDVARQASELLEAAGRKLHFGTTSSWTAEDNRRGDFSTISFGISYGSGQGYPKAMKQDKRNKGVLEDLLNDKVFARISGFAASKFTRFCSTSES
jgi:hypothetical protein